MTKLHTSLAFPHCPPTCPFPVLGHIPGLPTAPSCLLPSATAPSSLSLVPLTLVWDRFKQVGRRLSQLQQHLNPDLKEPRASWGRASQMWEQPPQSSWAGVHELVFQQPHALELTKLEVQ